MAHSRAFADASLNQLYEAIRQLSEVDRAVILLYLDEKSYREIGEIIGTNPNNVGVRALAIGIGESEPGQLLIRTIVEKFPDVRLVNGVPLVLIAVVVAMTIVVDLFGGVIFDVDVKTVYRGVFEKLDQMVAEMEELRG